MRAALIDGAVNTEFLRSIQNSKVCIRGAYAVSDGELAEGQAPVHGMTHASVCAGIFLSEVTVPCELWCIRVLDEEALRGNVDALLTALDFCGKQRMDVVSLSVGTTRIRDGGRLELKIRELTDRGTIIVAADSNRKMLTFPAAFDRVIGVREDTPSNRRCPSDAILYRSVRRTFTHKEQVIVTGTYNSYAAPAVTAKVCGFLSGGVADTTQIRTMLKQLKNVGESRRHRCGKRDKPVIFLDVRGDDKAARCMEKILDYFERHEYEGACISDTLRTDYAAGRLSLRQFARSAHGFRNRLWTLTNVLDSDFVIWHVTGQKMGKRCLRQIELVVTDQTEKWRGRKRGIMSDVLDEKTLDAMLEYLT